MFYSFSTTGPLSSSTWLLKNQYSTNTGESYYSKVIVSQRKKILMQCSKLGQFTIPETCENCLSCKHLHLLACQTHEIYCLYSVDFKVPRELWNPLSKTVLSKYRFILNKEPVNIWNDREFKTSLYIGPVNIFPNFLHWQWTLNNSWLTYVSEIHGMVVGFEIC